MAIGLPNALTLSRIAAIPVIVLLVEIGAQTCDILASLVFCAAAITDYFDGKLARTRRIESELGKMLDPIADKLLVAAVIMSLVGDMRISHYTLYPAMVIILREILVSGLREYLAKARIGLPVTYLAKWKTGFQMTALALMLAGTPKIPLLGLDALPLMTLGQGLLWVSACLTVVTGWTYLREGWSHTSRDLGRPSATYTNRR
ncbi:MAG TPA: CDP-diacylglycerol--glycerol-3-phosphate 3-phosphatidyltransferase [Rhodopila sp.]|uniref:CDP-diacylglycerol--glycerol-3-phosphate 3-phosphatidyltransferase n=1 Tax=Rhodopila sp. TaxID=2480087 RepID=UPI002CFCC271|nr:CDP-diacylglycerol--glycerol-3-phosphate 3-phosphatidyltransferase [Rhodopila sp.]HVY14072.1 CDP-diacylglycerol--glycerol-3-phosphate 3-phosphatidyltransferase [Rhodopila sp.]